MTDIAKTETTALSPFGQGAPINASDIILPGVSIRQNSFRKDFMKGIKPGAMVLRPDNTTLAELGKPVTFVPISIEKMYRICAITKNEARTIGYEPWGNVEKASVETRGDQQIRRDRTFVAHVLFREDLDSQAEMFKRLEKGETVDPSDFTLPCRIVFTRSSLTAGKLLNTFFELSRTIKQNPATISFELKTIESSNDKGNWFSFDVQKVKDQKVKYTPKEFLGACTFWVGAMANASQLKAHEDDDSVVVSAEVTQSANDEQRF